MKMTFSSITLAIVAKPNRFKSELVGRVKAAIIAIIDHRRKRGTARVALRFAVKTIAKSVKRRPHFKTDFFD